MLGEPRHGWVLFRLDAKSCVYDLSYLTDVAVEWLEQAIHGLETMSVFSVHGVCEPGRVICTVSYWNCYVVFEDEERDGAGAYKSQAHISMLEFCKTLHSDIRGHLDAWVHWNDPVPLGGQGEPDDDDEECGRREELRRLLDRLERLIDERERYFGPNRCFF